MTDVTDPTELAQAPAEPRKKLKRGKRSGLYYFSLQDIRDWGACYDPKQHLPDDWRGTAVDILNLEHVPFSDRQWVVLRTEIASEKLLRLFAVWCARQVQHLMTDPRSLAALDVAERFANGEATKDELDAARDAAWGAARDAAWGAAIAAAIAAARGAAEDAARGAAIAAAIAAARGAAEDAAWGAAWGAARGAAWGAQKSKLIEMLVAEGKESRQ